MFECLVLIRYFLKSFYVCRMLHSNSRKQNLHLLSCQNCQKKKTILSPPSNWGLIMWPWKDNYFFTPQLGRFSTLYYSDVSQLAAYQKQIYIASFQKHYHLSPNCFSTFNSVHNIVQFSTHIIDCTYWQLEFIINFDNFVNCYVLIISLFPD